MATWCGDLAVVPEDAFASMRGKRVSLVGSFGDRPSVLRQLRAAGAETQQQLSPEGEAPTEVIVVGSRPVGDEALAADVWGAAAERRLKAWQREARLLQRWMRLHPLCTVVDESFAELDREELCDRLLVGVPQLSGSPRRDRQLVEGERQLRVGRISGPEPPPGRGLSPCAFLDVNTCGESRTVHACDVDAGFLLLYAGFNAQRPPGVTVEEVLAAVAPIVHPRQPAAVVSQVLLRDDIDSYIAEAEAVCSPRASASPSAKQEAKAKAIVNARSPLLEFLCSARWRNPVAACVLHMPCALVAEGHGDEASVPFRGGRLKYRWDFEERPRALSPPPGESFSFSPARTDAARLLADPSAVSP